MHVLHFLLPLMVCFVAVPSYAQPTTTVLAHGFSPNSKGVWVQAMGEAILARAGGGSLYRYQGSTGRWTYVPVAAGDGTHNHIVLIFNWVPESDGPDAGPNWNYVQAAADVLYAMLRDPKYAGQVGPSNLVINRATHFIGHSRGACVMSETIRRLALANIPVDQFTAHDPHPVNGTLDAPYNFDWGDPVPQVWNNTTWADNYWRADGGGFINGLDFDGIPLANCHNVQLNESALNCCAYSYAHSDVHLWYHGTIDTGPNASDGEEDITSTMRNTWWVPLGSYVSTGYYFSAIGGGALERPAISSGVAAPPVNWIYNGEFEQGSRAGWSHHGGSVNGQIASESGNWFARLGAGQGGVQITHNRFFLPTHASAIEFDYRVVTAAPNESLEIVLTELFGASTVIGTVPINKAGGWITNVAIPLGCIVARGRNYTLTFRIASPGSAASVVAIDNIRLAAQSPPPGDVTGDGFVNVSDLLAVISSWGTCPASCPQPFTCPADLNGDCVVNVSDLLAVITSWGSCS